MYLFFNNEFHPASAPLFTAGNRAYRYGEGLFETMLYKNGPICFLHDHFNRLSGGIKALGLRMPGYFDLSFIERTATELVKKNGHEQAARIRLSVTAGNGMLNRFDPNGFECLIESFSIKKLPGQLNETGRTLGLFTGAKKNIDALSGYKTASHLTYALAARHAAVSGLDDCIVLNTKETVCDTSIANIFIITGEEICTPPLSCGCIAGIFREQLLQQLTAQQYAVIQREIHLSEIEKADEIFLTNVIQGIRWVEEYGQKKYGNRLIKKIAQDVLPGLYS